MKYADKNGDIKEVENSQDKLLKWLYSHRCGSWLIGLLVRPGISRAAGKLLESRCSVCLISPFVKRNKIDMSCYVKKKYASYNDFFTRRIKPGNRPLEGDGDALVCPCDGKLSVYPLTEGKNTQFSIKNTSYTVESLIGSSALAERFAGGWACIFRLTVDDYHRYCYIDDGKKSENHRIPGVFHTVNPAANDVVPVYKENTREFSILKSCHFKTILMMEVGALLVGRITNYDQGGIVIRGEEKGRFEFGGSTIVLLFQKNAVKIDMNFIENTSRGCETVVKMGEKIGKSWNSSKSKDHE